MSKGKGWSAAERVEMWRRYKAGESLGSIGRALGRWSGSIYSQVKPFGGIAPQRQRSARVLSLAEREEISRGLAADASIRSIAKSLGRAPSTVSREVRRHGGQYYPVIVIEPEPRTGCEQTSGLDAGRRRKLLISLRATSHKDGQCSAPVHTYGDGKRFHWPRQFELSYRMRSK